MYKMGETTKEVVKKQSNLADEMKRVDQLQDKNSEAILTYISVHKYLISLNASERYKRPAIC